MTTKHVHLYDYEIKVFDRDGNYPATTGIAYGQPYRTPGEMGNRISNCLNVLQDIPDPAEFVRMARENEQRIESLQKEKEAYRGMAINPNVPDNTVQHIDCLQKFVELSTAQIQKLEEALKDARLHADEFGAESHRMKAENERLIIQNAALTKQNQKQEEALRFYADEKNYGCQCGTGKCGNGDLIEDEGAKAREALK